MTDQSYEHKHASALGVDLKIKRYYDGMEATEKKIHFSVSMTDDDECTLRVEERTMEVRTAVSPLYMGTARAADSSLPLRWITTGVLEFPHLRSGDLDLLMGLLSDAKDALEDSKSS